ncbi:ROK family transcriptional regulator [Catenulispora sp. NF23]|uniref:ROK family transcriptional regulator n=1 Tax=Catenulispora pinistramenti TaxID=2705254 RepID=UPI001BA9F56E|nr:ROK family transcriptional regulator [Catenulispora pinistramenti]MBS2538128.1 ROK family transcriptional regulator [Catenulispora pinistramenti]
MYSLPPARSYHECHPDRFEEGIVAAPPNLREEGRLRVLQVLLASSTTSRPELVRLTGLSRATVSVLVADLIAAGLVLEENGSAEAENRSMGRPALPLALNRSVVYAIGVDIGHAHVRVALCDVHGTPLWETVEAKEVDRAPHETLDLAADLVARAIAENGVARERVLGLGVGIAAPVDADGALSAEGIMPGWTGIRPGPELERRTGLTIELTNDANAGALAEHMYGAGRDSQDMVYIRLSAGIGAGVIAAGRLQLGAGGLAGEIGHLPATPDGLVCRCGNRGCLETIASPVAVARLLQESWGEPVTPADLPDLLATGTPGAARVIEDTGEAVGRALASVITLMNPRLIVVGGDLAALGEALFTPIRHGIARYALPSAARQVTVVPGRRGSSAEVRGAAARVLARAPQTLAMMSGGESGELSA